MSAVRYPRMSEARKAMLRGPGWLYAARSRYCDWIKIGFTAKSAKVRLDGCNEQYAEFAPFSLIGALPSSWSAEQQLHRLLAPFRQRQTGRTKELYPAVPSLVRAIDTIFANDRWDLLEFSEWREVSAWVYRASAHPLNRNPALESFDLFRSERAAPNGPRGGIGTVAPSSLGRASATHTEAA
jgi:hypothetical protein